MFELSRDDFGRALPLFKDVPHSHSFVFSLFEGNHTGRAFANHPQQLTAAVLDLACEFTFVAGEVGDGAFSRALQDDLLAKLRAGKFLFLVAFTDAWRDLLQGMLTGENVLNITRGMFSINRTQFAPHANWRVRIQAGFTVKPYDRALAESANGINEFWGSVDQFLAHGLGYAVLKGDEVVSRCHTVLAGAGHMEISVETAEPYRRQGLATLAACAFIEHCLDHGLHPDWSCWTANAASLALAEKLGFSREPDVPVIFVMPRQSP